jgi:hypothetical protein
MGQVVRANEHDAGCWVDGHWGQYGPVRLCDIAQAAGWGGNPLPYNADQAMDMDYDQRDEWEGEAADQAEAWLNEHVAPAGFMFGWHEGEFFLWSDVQWLMLDGEWRDGPGDNNG